MKVKSLALHSGVSIPGLSQTNFSANEVNPNRANCDMTVLAMGVHVNIRKSQRIEPVAVLVPWSNIYYIVLQEDGHDAK